MAAKVKGFSLFDRHQSYIDDVLYLERKKPEKERRYKDNSDFIRKLIDQHKVSNPLPQQHLASH